MRHAYVRIGSYVQALCTALRCAGSPAALGALAAARRWVAQRVIDLTESVARRGVRGLFAGLGRFSLRSVVALSPEGTDALTAKPQAKRVFSAADV